MDSNRILHVNRLGAILLQIQSYLISYLKTVVCIISIADLYFMFDNYAKYAKYAIRMCEYYRN